MTNLIPLDDAEINASTREFPVPEQHGPLRWFDTYFRCASKGCSSATMTKLQGIPYCTMHTLRRMNEQLTELGMEK